MKVSSMSGAVLRRGRAMLSAMVARAGLAALLACAVATPAQAQEEKKRESSAAELEHELAQARQRLDAAAREVADLSRALSEHVIPHALMSAGMGMQRGMLGINLGTARETSATEGVEIVSVSPGGAAAEAGLRAGDVLLEVNSTPLKQQGERSPREQLLAVMREVQPGDKVAVSYRREGKVLKAQLVAEPFGGHLFRQFARRHGDGPHRFSLRHAAGAFGSAELVSMTPKLGQYFGTQTGLLVVRAPQDSRLKLEEGDVILAIDGRTPSSPAHALRILESYQAGEKLKLDLLRAKKRLSVEVTIPDEPWNRSAGTGQGGGGAGILVRPDAPLMPRPGALAIATPLPGEPI